MNIVSFATATILLTASAAFAQGDETFPPYTCTPDSNTNPLLCVSVHGACLPAAEKGQFAICIEVNDGFCDDEPGSELCVWVCEPIIGNCWGQNFACEPVCGGSGSDGPRRP